MTALSLANASRGEAVRFQVTQAIREFADHETDTGSTPVQVAVLTIRINSMRIHLEVHKKDNSGRRGLMAMVTKRRKLLLYLERKDFGAYARTIKALDLV
jgi:small subunit ribosomal protein S15